MKFILGLKIGMSQIFDEKGNQIPVTVVESGPCRVLQIKTKEKDGYEAVQIGFKKKKDEKVKKPQKETPFKYIKEFSLPKIQQLKGAHGDNLNYKKGQKLDVSIFEEGDSLSVSGISKGKGFQGAVKKWGFHGRPTSHGMKHESRTLGSVGGSTPSRVIKGRKMPGRMGGERKTVRGLTVVKIDLKNNALMISGAVPGRRGTLLEIKSVN